MSTTGLILTNFHVVRECQQIRVAKHGVAEILRVSLEDDLAALLVRRPVGHNTAILQAAVPPLGSSIVAGGFPLSDLFDGQFTVAFGQVTSRRGIKGTQNQYSMSVPVQPGNSGGPIVNEKGEVVGIATGKLNDAVMMEVAGTTGANFSFAVGPRAIRRFLQPFNIVTRNRQLVVPGRRRAGCPRQRGTCCQHGNLHGTDHLRASAAAVETPRINRQTTLLLKTRRDIGRTSGATRQLCGPAADRADWMGKHYREAVNARPRIEAGRMTIAEDIRSGGLDSAYAWTRLVLSVVIATAGSVGMWAVILVLPEVQADFGTDRGLASVPFTATMVGFAFGNMLLGRHVDRFGIVPVLIASSLMLAAGFALAALTANIWQFALIQGTLIGIGTAASFGPLIADVSHWFVKRRGIAVAAVACGNYLAGSIWPQLLKGVIAAEGWRAAFLILAVACLVIMIPLSFLLRRRLPASANDIATGGGAGAVVTHSIDLSPRALQILLAIAGVGCCVAMSMPQVHIVAYCVDLGFGSKTGAEMLSLMLVGGVVSRLASGFLADYIGGVRTLLIGSTLQCIALFLYIPFDGLASLYVVSMIFGLSQGGIVPSYALIVREYLPAREAGQRVGTVIMATVFGMALGGWMSGWIYDLTGSYSAAFINGIGWNLLNIAIMLVMLTRTRSPQPVMVRG